MNYFLRFSWLLLILISRVANAQVRLPPLISDGMVLQRDTKLNLWGWAAPDEKIRIRFNGKTYRLIAGNDGKWSVILLALKAGGPFVMNIDATNHITIRDILIGDVWFCSGQSNMVLPMERIKEKYPDEIANANYPQIRNFFIPAASDIEKVQEDLPPVNGNRRTPKMYLTLERLPISLHCSFITNITYLSVSLMPALEVPPYRPG